METHTHTHIILECGSTVVRAFPCSVRESTHSLSALRPKSVCSPPEALALPDGLSFPLSPLFSLHPSLLSSPEQANPKLSTDSAEKAMCVCVLVCVWLAGGSLLGGRTHLRNSSTCLQSLSVAVCLCVRALHNWQRHLFVSVF